LAAQGFAAHGFLAAQGFAAHGFLAAQGFAAHGFVVLTLAAQGFLAAQGLPANAEPMGKASATSALNTVVWKCLDCSFIAALLMMG
jgi:hypothetical protein